ncbi:hypothetical protein E2C01_013335 [Portunus trituberculatus]|uniref:Uncharacterized protein n=1 Tax=Portunus trituberculatus TaxID=210409 RepID=A0A5B7DGV1_PORTR|nr:hypothetical protein [Portunus trituberculatus]
MGQVLGEKTIQAVENTPLPAFHTHLTEQAPLLPQLLRLLSNEPVECMYTRMQMEIPAGIARDREAGGGARDGTADGRVSEGNTNK